MELLVSMALFSAIIIISTGVFVRIVRSERAAAARQKAYDNARFVFENVARNVRVSRFCPSAYLDPPVFTNCGSMDPGVNSGKILEVDHPTREPSLVTYRWDDTSSPPRLLENDAPLSGSEVFTKMWFLVEGVGSEGLGIVAVQPHITILGEIETQGIAEERLIVRLQTSMSQRLLETEF